MKYRLLSVVIVLLIIGAFFAGNSFSEDKKMSDEQAKMMAEWAKYSTPDEHHRALDPLVGSWEFVSKSQMTPESPVQESKGTSEVKWIFGNRYIQEEVTGDMGGMPFHGLSLAGYDLVKKEYFNVWIDEMSTGIWVTTGQMDASGKVLTVEGSYPDFMNNMKETKTRSVVKIISNDQHIMEMYMGTPDGGEFKSMEITYTRKK